MEDISNMYRSKRKEAEMLKAFKKKKFINAEMAGYIADFAQRGVFI